MGGRVLDLDIIRIKHEGREEGREEERKNTERERNRADDARTGQTKPRTA